MKAIPERSVISLLALIFVLSGFSGLIYQSIWTHYLKLFLGHAAYSQALVLATFMGGLALGSWWAARLSSDGRRLLLWYAAAEAAVGLYALLFHQAFVQLMALSFDTVLPALSSGSLAQLFKWTAAMALILPPSILLGTTFPLMAEGVIARKPAARGRLLGVLYAGNSLGAAAGVLASGLVLINWLGLPGTVQLAGLLNLAVAVAVLLVLAMAESTTGRSVAAASGVNKEELNGAVQTYRVLLACAALTGLASFVYEIIWIRMLTMVLGSATNAFELMLASFILGLAIGGWLIRRYIDQLRQPLVTLAWIQLLMGLLAGSTLLFYNQLFELMALVMQGLKRNEQGFVMFKLASFSLAMLVMLPATICAGMTLPLVTAALAGGGYGVRATGHVYALNTLGAIAGVALGSLLLMPLIGLRATLIIAAAIDVGLAILLVWTALGSWRSPRFGVVCGVGLAGLLLVASYSQFDTLRMASSVYRTGKLHEKGKETVVFHRDGRTATVAVLEGAGGYMSIATNGKTDASISAEPNPVDGDEETMKLLAAMPLALRPQATTAAVIGFGSGMSAHTLLGSEQLERVDTIEIEPAMVAGARLFGAPVARAYEDPRSQVVIDDARTFFSVRQQAYDLIVSEPSNPWVSGVAGLFSQEHYREVKKYLKPGGVYTQWLQLYEFDLELAFSVLKAFSAEFDDYALYQGANSDLVILGVARGKLRQPGPEIFTSVLLRDELTRIGVHSAADLQSRFLIDKNLLEPLLSGTPFPANSDYQPFVDQNAEKARFLDGGADQLERLHRVWLLLQPLRQRQLFSGQVLGQSHLVGQRAGEAMTLRELFRTQLQVDPRLDPGAARLPYETAVSVSRLLYRCNPQMVEDGWLADAVWLSDVTSIYAPPGMVTPFWDALIDSDCFVQLAPHLQATFHFFRAASERDDAEIIRLGGLLVGYRYDISGFWNYRIFHMLAAHARLGQPVEAARLAVSVRDTGPLELDSQVLAAWLAEQAKAGVTKRY